MHEVHIIVVRLGVVLYGDLSKVRRKAQQLAKMVFKDTICLPSYRYSGPINASYSYRRDMEPSTVCARFVYLLIDSMAFTDDFLGRSQNT